MSSQDSISVLPVSLLPGKTGPVFCLLTAVPPGSLPSCPGLVSAQLLQRGLQTVPQCLPSSTCIFLLPCLLPCQVFEPFLHQSKELANWLQEGEKGGRMWLRGSRSVHTLCWGSLSILTHCNWSVSLGKKRPEGLKKPKNRSEEHSCACLNCLPGSHRPKAGQKTQPSIRWSRLLPVHSNPGASLLWASTQHHESLSTGYACPVDKVTVVCPT